MKAKPVKPSTQKLNKASVPFLTLPCIMIAWIPGILNQTYIPKFACLVFGTLILLYIQPNFKVIRSVNFLALCLFTLSYVASQLVTQLDLETFLLGSNGRFVGYIALICLFIQYLFYANLDSLGTHTFLTYLNYSFILILIIRFLLVSGIVSYRDDDFFGSGAVVTMENSNSLSAYLGLVISVIIYFLLYGTKSEKIVNSILFLFALDLLFATKSIQGFVIIFISIILLLIHKLFHYLKSRKVIIFSLALFFLLLIYGYERISSWLVLNGSVNQRISYWKLALEIWQDNFWVGVGIENMRSYSILYRDLSLVIQEGVNTAPDRAHNIILDHYVSGGFFTGTFWLIFITSITVLSISLYLRILKGEAEFIYLGVIVIWIGYLFQSLISVSPSTLTFLGYASAGIVAGAMYKNRNSKVIN